MSQCFALPPLPIMKKNSIFLLTLLFALSGYRAIVADTPSASALPLSNGSFEEGTTGWSLFVPPDSKDKNCHFTISHDSPHTGSSCALMQADTFARCGLAAPNISIQPGERYRITAWVRGGVDLRVQPNTAGILIRLTLLQNKQEAPGGDFYLALNGNMTRKDIPTNLAAVPAQWTRMEAVVETPADADTMRPCLFFWRAMGSLYIDDFTVEKVDASVPLTSLIPSPSVTTDATQDQPSTAGPMITNVTMPAIFAASTNTPPPSKHTWDFDRTQALQELEEQGKIIDNPTDTLGVREIFRFALEAAGLGWDPDKINKALTLARSMQDLDPKSPTYGNFKWAWGQQGVFDKNAVEFCMTPATLLRLHYSESLNAEGKAALDDLISTGLEGVKRHEVKVEYTNMYLSKTWNLISLGEVLGRPEVTQGGYAQLQNWIDNVSKIGVSEYNAPTYYGVDLDALDLIYNNAKEPSAKALAEMGLRFFWTQIAANWWSPGNRISGANGRDYDYLYGRGYMEKHTGPLGWLSNSLEPEAAGSAHSQKNLVTYFSECNLNPPAEWTEPLRNEIPRTVVQKWGPNPFERCVNYVGKYFTLGSSGASKGREERTLVANLGDLPSVPELSFFMDARGDPYGTKKSAEAQGAMKALHIQPFIATVQHGPELIQVLSYQIPKKARDKVTCLLSHLLIPAQAEVWVDGGLVQPGTADAPVSLPDDKLICIHMGNAALALRFLWASTPQGEVAPIQYVLDGPDGVAKRITVVHSASTPSAGMGTVAIWMYGEDGVDDAHLASWCEKCSSVPFTAKLTDGLLALEVKSERGPLRIEADLNKSYRNVLSGGEPDALFSVNGRDIGREILPMPKADAAVIPGSTGELSK
ncbi:MAG: hypothetical protein LV481_04405 [Methylacidiphilales bacterium]|nr:hypothetical protein [Candidatus Methylacidiphilales bacterium]